MLFSSIPFLYYFLPVVLLLYFVVPFKLKNLVLLVASLFFYFYGEPVYVLLMLVSCLSSYIHGLLIDKFKGTKWAKVWVVSSVTTSLLMLGFFKYSNFFIENFNALTKSNVALLNIALPIGISFYTFQTLSYTIDVYRGDAKVQKSFIRLATYVALFPQLIAGPIVRYTTVEEDLTERKHSIDSFGTGATRFVIGLAKKVLIADVLYEFCNAFRASDDKSVVFYWLYAIAFSLHIYFDFSGYSDMAIGLGRIFGFRFLENFNYPYISKSVAEFWRRWHMSLGTWFRDYVYIPLGGNRVSNWRWFFNTLTVWFLTGFWHGAAWTFIVWGLYFAAFLLLEKFFLKKFFDKIPRVFSHIYVLVAVAISFVVFNAADLKEAVSDIGGMFGALDIPLWSKETAYYLSNYAVLFIAAVLGATPLFKNTVLKLKENNSACKVIDAIEPVFVAAIIIVVTACFVNGSFSPFLYFRF
ncbi:MAG: MBOAT family protein [Ruminococcaceae bacterium]|nr:MBOAT family protein [Oscillospiraceae bacterium]